MMVLEKFHGTIEQEESGKVKQSKYGKNRLSAIWGNLTLRAPSFPSKKGLPLSFSLAK